MKYVLLSLISLLVAGVACARNYSISGRVTDYNGLPVDSCSVMLFNPDFNPALVSESDADGFYRLDSVPEGRYAAIAAIRLNEYPRMQQVPPEDMKLEFWAWNVVLDRDLDLNIRYGKLELYGTRAFYEYGGRQELLIYTRPMSVTKAVLFPDYADKSAMERNSSVTVAPKFMEFRVYVDGRPIEILSVQHLSLPNTNGNSMNDDCYLIQTTLPENNNSNPEKPHEIRVVGHNKEYDEWGESVYYLEIPQYSKIK